MPVQKGLETYGMHHVHKRWYPLFKLHITKTHPSTLMVTFDVTKLYIDIPHELGKKIETFHTKFHKKKISLMVWN